MGLSMEKQGLANTQPSIRTVLTSIGTQDRRNLSFWCIELGGTFAFAFWLFIAIRLSHTFSPSPHGPPPQPVVSLMGVLPNGLAFSAGKTGLNPDNPARILAGDIWFALGLATVVDAFAVVGNFNRVLLKQFHHVVNLRMMLLASVISFEVFIWVDQDIFDLLQYRVLLTAFGFAIYMLGGQILDAFRPPIPTKDACYHPSSLQLYSENLSQFDVSWRKAAFLTGVTGGAGLMLTISIPPSFSGFVPIFQIGFESLFLSAVKASRTPRYIILCSPLLQALICVHWGIMTFSTSMRLTIAPEKFLALILIGRFLLDMHLWTILRSRPELIWARKEVLVSTRQLVGFCAIMYVVELAGLPVISYSKPTCVLLFFFLSSAGYLAPAAYVVAFGKVKRIRE